MKRYLLLLLFLHSFNSFAQTKVYRGTIGKTDSIEMHLLTLGTGIFGYYYHDSDRKFLPLHTEGKNRLKLIEGFEYENIFFKIAANGKIINGTWFRKDDSLKIPFRVQQTGTEIINKEYANGAGEYSSGGEYHLEKAIFHPINKDYLYFEIFISQGPPWPCEADITKIAKRTENLTWTFSEKYCDNLTIKFKNKAVEVSEHSCEGYHGAHCYFNTTYSR